MDNKTVIASKVREADDNGPIVFDLTADQVRPEYYPVSYTHLDVYKRQEDLRSHQRSWGDNQDSWEVYARSFQRSLC